MPKQSPGTGLGKPGQRRGKGASDSAILTDLHERRPFKLRVSADAGFVPTSVTYHSCLFLPVCCRAPLRSHSGPEEQKKPE